MARITIESIQKELEVDGWKILSTSYSNLDTELEFECDEGHKVYAPWKKIRQARECPICKQNHLKVSNFKIQPKKTGVTRTLGLDQATKISGWSIYDNKKLIAYGIFETQHEDETHRFNDVKMWLINMINSWKPDMVGIEGIQYEQNFGVTTFQTLARLQGVLMETCFEQKVEFYICPTNTWRAHCKVKGKTRADKKASMRLLAKEWFDVSVSEDEADAIGIGKYIAESFKKKTETISWE